MPRDYSVASTSHRSARIEVEPKKIKLPINLQRKAQREARNRNEPPKNRKFRRKRKINKANIDLSEHEALKRTTEEILKRILSESEALNDIPYDCTPDELLAEIALASGDATTIYVERDGLSTLTVVLPQPNPTIANLKRAIEATARVQMKRELRERFEERQKRRQQQRQPNVEEASSVERNSSPSRASGGDEAARVENVSRRSRSTHQRRDVLSLKSSTGELVCSAARIGHHHRPNVSWRFLWRAYALYDPQRKSPVDDQNGRKLLIDCGIENATTLKFCKRENYYGRKRQ